MDWSDIRTFDLDGGSFTLEDVDGLAHLSVADDQVGLVLLVLDHPLLSVQLHAWWFVGHRYVDVSVDAFATFNR